MTDSDTPLNGPLASLDKGARHRMIAMALLRMLLSIGILIAVFVIVPPDDIANGRFGIGLFTAFVLLAALVAWEMYRTLNDPVPEVRAATSLLVLVTAIVILFALAYAGMSSANPDAFTEPLGKSDAVYFAVTTLSTTGFGDITALSEPARWVVTTQMLFDLVLLVGLARVFMLVAKAGKARQKRT